MQNFIQKLKLVYHDSILRKKILFVLGALVVFRAFSAIPVPGIDHTQLGQLFQNNQFLGLLNIFSGGGLSAMSIAMLGLGPYITSSIIMQLLTMIFPKLKAMYHEEGEAGRQKFTQYSRLLTVPLAIMQSYAYIILLQRSGVIPSLEMFDLIVNISLIVGGSMFLMWLGELITEFGIGNGVSLLIFAGIVSALPGQISQLYFAFDPSQIPLYLAFVGVAIVIIFGTVYITEAERPVPITYAKRVRGNKVFGGVSTYLPLRINQAGVIPIIFALSFLLFPQMIFSLLTKFNNEIISNVSNAVNSFLQNGWVYAAIYFVLVFVFTYFYTAVTFDPHAISQNLQKSGAFIPGVRPGDSTTDHVAKIVTRTTLVGALFLGIIAVLPLIMKAATGIANLAIGGTGLLIVVSVVIDLIKKVEAQISMREY